MSDVARVVPVEFAWFDFKLGYNKSMAKVQNLVSSFAAFQTFCHTLIFLEGYWT